MAVPELSISVDPDAAVLHAGRLTVELPPRPFSFTIRRDGRSLLKHAGAWVADGTVRDRFIQFTEGVVAAEDRSPPQRTQHALLMQRGEGGLTLGFRLEGGRNVRLGIDVAA